MKFSDFPKEQVILAVYDALDYIFHDCPVRAYPYFYVRSNQEYHICQIRDIMDEFDDKYGDIHDSIMENDDLRMQYWKLDILKLHSVKTIR